MARGRYELPSGHSKTFYGPRRIPTRPTTASSTCTSQSPTVSHPNVATARQPQPVVAIVSLPTSIHDNTEAVKVRSQLETQMMVQEVTDIELAITAFSHRPSAVYISKASLAETTHERLRRAAIQYVQCGGILITEFSQVPIFLDKVIAARSHSVKLSTVNAAAGGSSTLASTLRPLVIEPPMS